MKQSKLVKIISLFSIAICIFILPGQDGSVKASPIAASNQVELEQAVFSLPPTQIDVLGEQAPECTPRINIRKQVEGPDTRLFASGSDVTFEIFVKNTGDVALSAVVVTDDLAPGCARSIGSLAVGASTTYSCTVSAVTQGFTNVAKVEGYYSTTKVTDEDPSTVQIASIDLRKQAEGPDTRAFASGSDVTFEIFVQNTGEVALTDVVVTDELAPGCAKSIGALAVGASTTYSCTVPAVTQGFTNVATVVGYSSTVQVTDEDPSTVQIAKIDLRKQAEGPDEREISYGTDVSFDIFVENTGEVTLNDVTVTDEQVPGCGHFIGTLEPGGTYSYSCVAPAVTEGFTNTAIVTGVVDNFQVSDEDPSTVKIRLYELYFPYLSGGSVTKYNLTLGYEDLRLDQQNDFDYNDWVVSVITNLSYSYQDPQTVSLRRIAMFFTPKARGAMLNHEYRLKFAPNTFGSDGTATVVVKDGQGNILSTNHYAFVSAQTNDFLIFDCTCNALPNGMQFMNTNEGTGPYPTQRTAEFTIDFASEATFILADYGPHGEGLFFDPYIRVTGWGQEIYDVGIDDVRTLVAPIPDWKWAEEGARIDYAYPAVTYIGSPNMFTFPILWWQTNTTCVYGDGVVCVVP